MMDNVFEKSYETPMIRTEEILRYASCREAGAEVSSLVRECIAECEKKLCYRVCYRRFPVYRDGDWLDLGFARTRSAGLIKNLQGCDEAVVFAATVGIHMDRLIARYSRTSAARSLIMCAVGSERVESLCDAFAADIAREAEALGKRARPRFSPGYGDLPIELQRDIFRALEPERRIGLSLNESLLMSPSKSVTAIIGIG